LANEIDTPTTPNDSANIGFNGAELGTELTDLLCCDDIQPGSEPSYQVCKTIYLYHPLGAKMAASPIKLAQSQPRNIHINVESGLEEKLKKQFLETWRALDADGNILNHKSQSRVYGICTIVMMAEGVPAEQPIDYFKLPDLEVTFNILDPLNTAGSMVLNQNPNAEDFQKPIAIAVAGKRYHRSRGLVVMNEKPIYISYTSSAYGFVGRSVYQRALFPLKSFINTMVTDDMVTKKAGLLIAMIQTVSSAVNRLQAVFGAVKRNLLKTAVVGNVLQVGEKDKIETLNMQNLDGAFGMARKDILENIAVSADMPAVMLNSETFAQGFADGSEDAKNVAHYLDRMREEMNPQYAWFDLICMHKAWSPAFYKTIQKEYPDRYGKVDYKTAFLEWKNSFSTSWPNFLTEPDSEKVKTDETKLKAAVAVFQVLEPICDPESKATLATWLCDTVNTNKTMFPVPLNLDPDLLMDYVPPEQQAMLEEPKPAKPFSASDASKAAVAAWLGAPGKDLTPRQSMRALLEYVNSKGQPLN